MIMAWLPCDESKLHCYTHRGVFRECADARIARQVATVCKQPHRVVTVDGEFFSDFPVLARQTVYTTDGTMDVSGAAGLFVNRIARQEIAPVRVTGNYGGQVLRGIVALNPAKRLSPVFDKAFSECIQQGIVTLASERRDCRASLIAFKQMPWYHYGRFAMESSQLTIRSPFLDNDLVALAYQAPTDLAVNRGLAARLIADGHRELGKIRERYQEFTFKAEYAYDYGMPHWLARMDRLLSPLHLERMFLGRHKYYHFRLWYRHQLSKYVQDVLLDPRSLSKPYIDRRRVETMVKAHVTGRGNYTSDIHSLLTAELIHRELIEQN
jgi:asparagine synthase (glutamine-hydrolysing)